MARRYAGAAAVALAGTLILMLDAAGALVFASGEPVRAEKGSMRVAEATAATDAAPASSGAAVRAASDPRSCAMVAKRVFVEGYGHVIRRTPYCP